MKITNNFNLPESLAEAVERKFAYTGKGTADFTVSQLIGPSQKLFLEKENESSLEEDVSERLYALMGSAMHAIIQPWQWRLRDALEDFLARTESGAFKKPIETVLMFVNTLIKRKQKTLRIEERLTGDFFGKTVSGQFDVWREGVLRDWKFASVWESIFGLKPERIAQLNMYALLCRENGIEVDRLQVVFLFRDWSRSKAEYDAAYPQKQVEVIDVPLWTIEQQLEYVRSRFQAHEAPQNCTDDERWAKPSKWAVMKAGRKSAVKLYDSAEGAEQHIENAPAKSGLSIDFRQGESNRCMHYCPVAGVCEQFKQEQENMNK